MADGTRRKGNLIHINCPVKYYFYTPLVKRNSPLTHHLAILSYGEHNHPPPPMRRIAPVLRGKIISAITKFGLAEATARKLIASSYMPLILNGQEELNAQHLALLNQSAIDHIIRVERTKQFPHGTDFLGVQYRMTHQDLTNPYVRVATMYPDGQFMIACQFKEQSRLLFEADEIHIDKTFKRTNCRELEINIYSHEARHIGTIARIFTDSEDELGYYRAINLVSEIAEEDMGAHIPWGHLTLESSTSRHIKAILVDEHGGQAKGLGRYFTEKYPSRDTSQHLLKIVKTCRVHYERSIHKLEGKNVPKGKQLRHSRANFFRIV